MASFARFFGIVVIPVCMAFVPTAEAQHCGCKGVSAASLEAADKALFLSNSDEKAAFQRHMPYGKPGFPRVTYKRDETLLIHKDFVINYDADLRMPRYVAYYLTKQNLSSDRPRKNCFRPDPRIKVDRDTAFCADYEEPIYDRGHMAPNSDFERSLEAMLNTYMFTNMAPQHAGFNQGVWVDLEIKVRKWAKKRGSLYIITGAMFDRDGDGERDSDHVATRMVSNDGLARVAVASHFYKILVDRKAEDKFEAIAILLKHDADRVSGSKAKKELELGITTIDEIEAITKYDFFPSWQQEFPDAINGMERRKAAALWQG